jgi:hypothetical protein
MTFHWTDHSRVLHLCVHAIYPFLFLFLSKGHHNCAQPKPLYQHSLFWEAPSSQHHIPFVTIQLSFIIPFTSRFCCLLAVCLWLCYSISLYLSVFICEIGHNSICLAVCCVLRNKCSIWLSKVFLSHPLHPSLKAGRCLQVLSALFAALFAQH